jgi:hypothetical protein
MPQAQEAMRGFRAALAEAGGQHLLGSFTYADMVFAIVLQALCPPGQPRTCVKAPSCNAGKRYACMCSG